MFYAKNNRIFSLCTAVKYTHTKETTTNYLNSPRPCHNFIFMLEGEGEIVTQERKIRLKSGDFLFIPQGTTYLSIWKANPKTVFHSIHFNFSAQYDPFANIKIPVQKVRIENFSTLYENVLAFHTYQYEKSPNSFFALSAFYKLCGELLPFIEHEETETLESNPISPAIEYIQTHYAEKCTVEELAELCFLSPSRFYYHFKTQTGYSPIVYKNRICIQQAAQALLLEKYKSIEKIAEEYGFESAVYFRRLFKSVIGKTPTQYKKEETFL